MFSYPWCQLFTSCTDNPSYDKRKDSASEEEVCKVEECVGHFKCCAKKDVQLRPQNFGGGGGTGLSVVPVGFLVCDKDGDVEFINVSSKGKPDPVDQIADLVERTPDIIAKIKALFAKDKSEDDAEATATEETAE